MRSQKGNFVRKKRLADLFSSAGGAAMGYHRAGFEVVGFDIEPQPRYPFEFHQMDAFDVDLSDFDAVHASPPCQHYSTATPLWARPNHPDLIASTRRKLVESGLPYVMENVENAWTEMPTSAQLCGTFFGLGVPYRDMVLHRHRLFETNWGLKSGRCFHDKRRALPVFGNGVPSQFARWLRETGQPSVTVEDRGEAMGIDWMTLDELCEAIPPAFTEYIGKLLMFRFELLQEAGTPSSCNAS